MASKAQQMKATIKRVEEESDKDRRIAQLEGKVNVLETNFRRMNRVLQDLLHRLES